MISAALLAYLAAAIATVVTLFANGDIPELYHAARDHDGFRGLDLWLCMAAAVIFLAAFWPIVWWQEASNQFRRRR